MAVISKKITDFLNSEEALEAKQHLQEMTGDATFNTRSTYTSDSGAYPNNLIPFVDKHINYLSVHPQVDVTVYLANLRLMTRVR